MTDDITKHVEALRAKVPAIAEQVYVYLTSEAWHGWKPEDIFDVQATLNSLLDDIEDGSGWTETCGLFARVNYDEDAATEIVTLGFTAEWTTAVDPFEGTIAVLGV